MATNTASNYTDDVLDYLDEKLLPIAQRTLVSYGLGEPIKLDKGRGRTYKAIRLKRLPLPFTSLSEGVPPVGLLMDLEPITGVVDQWGALGNITDVAEETVFHPPFQNLIKMLGLQAGETLERNTYNTLMSGTQVQFANNKASRFNLLATDVMTSAELIKVTGILRVLGAPAYDGSEETNINKDARMGGANASKSPRVLEHFICINHPSITSDLRGDTDIKTAWSRSDVNRLYNHEIGEWNSVRFCESNMVPGFTGVAAVSGSAGTAGALASDDYFIIVTGSDTQNQYESLIYQVSAGITVTGPTGSVDVTLPSTPGFTYSVYIGTTTSPVNLGLSTAGPTTGPLIGQATQLAAGATVTITNLGLAQVPPAPVATGVTVYPSFIFGRGAYGQVELSGMKYTYLDKADKSDPLNQLLTAGWKVFYGTIILNNTFMARIESGTAFPINFV